MRIKLIGLGFAALGLLGACGLPGGSLFPKFVIDNEDNDTFDDPQDAGALVLGQEVIVKGTVSQTDFDEFRFQVPSGGPFKIDYRCTPVLTGLDPAVFTDFYDELENFIDGDACDPLVQTTDDDVPAGQDLLLDIGIQPDPVHAPVSYELRFTLVPAA